MRKIVITLFLTLSFSVWAVEDLSKNNKNQVESLEDSINKLSEEIKTLSASLKPVNSAFTPKIKRIFIEYGHAKGEINDLANDFLGQSPRGLGKTDQDSTRLGAQFSLTPRLSGSLSGSFNEGNSDITNSLVRSNTNSKSSSYSASLNYLITPWLTGGFFLGKSNGHADSSTNSFGVLQNSPRTEVDGSSQGVLLSAVLPISDKIFINLSPSYTTNLIKQKFPANNGDPELNQRYRLSLVNLDANFNYLFTQPNIIITGGATGHLVQHETQTMVNGVFGGTLPLAASRSDWSTVYLRARYIHPSLYEIYASASTDLGNDVYANNKVYSLGIAKSF
jgi:hypothetical protein